MVYAAHFHDDFQLSRSFGWDVEAKSFDWSTLISNKNTEIERLNGIYEKLLVNSGVNLLNGHAKLIDAHTVEVNGQQYSAEHILIAVGGWPQVPDIAGREHVTGLQSSVLYTRAAEASLSGWWWLYCCGVCLSVSWPRFRNTISLSW